MRGKAFERFAGELYAAPVAREKAGGSIDQARFAGTIRADQANDLPCRHDEADIGERPPLAVANRQCLDRQGRPGAAGNRFWQVIVLQLSRLRAVLVRKFASKTAQ